MWLQNSHSSPHFLVIIKKNNIHNSCILSNNLNDLKEKFHCDSIERDLSLRSINFDGLSLKDKNRIIMSADYDGLRNMFGSMVAVPLKLFGWISPHNFLQAFIQEHNTTFETVSIDQRINLHFLIEEDGTHATIGFIYIYIYKSPKQSFTLSGQRANYAGVRPVYYLTCKLIEVGFFQSKKYRRKGIAKSLLKPILQQIIRTYPTLFENRVIYFKHVLRTNQFVLLQNFIRWKILLISFYLRSLSFLMFMVLVLKLTWIHNRYDFQTYLHSINRRKIPFEDVKS